MSKYGNAEKNQLGLPENKNKYDNQDYYIDIESQNDSHSIIARNIMKNLSDNLTKVLDIGCGCGFLGDFLKNKNVILDGIEVDIEAIKEAKSKGIYRNIYNSSIEEIIGKIKERYNYIVLADVIEHLVEPYKIIENLKNLLDTDGKIIISIPNFEHIDVISNLINGKFNYNNAGTLDSTHLRFFTYNSFLEMIENINQKNQVKYDVEFLGNTKVYPENINYNSELYKIINSNHQKNVFQNVFQLSKTASGKEPKSIDKLLINNLNYYNQIEQTIEQIPIYYNKIQELEEENNILTNELLSTLKKTGKMRDEFLYITGSRTWKVMEPVRKAKRFSTRVINKLSRAKSKIKVAIDKSQVEKIEYDIDNYRLTVDELVDLLKQYDIISFDIFDTLIFRPFINPTDLFLIYENNYYVDGFANNRVKAEQEARKKTKKRHFEINIYDIYEELNNYITINQEEAIEKEFELEKASCYANPYMLEVVRKLQKLNKKIIVTSDMYWPKDFLVQIIDKCGYNLNEIYVSCDYQEAKGTGNIQRIISEKYPNKNIIHVGDNYNADVEGSKKAGWNSYYYKKCLEIASEYDEPIYDDSLVNTITSAIKYNYLYSGHENYSRYFKYGFIYGGILTCGFLENINKQVKNNKINKILFLARDSKIFYEAYKKYYNNYPSNYLITSRSAMLEISFDKKTEDFIEFYFKPRALAGNTSFEDALIETDLEVIIPYLKDYNLNINDYLTTINYDRFKKLIYDKKDIITKYFANSKKYAIEYFNELTKDTQKALAVDLGWSGTIVTLMRPIFHQDLEHPVELFGAFIGNKDTKKINALIDNNIFNPYCFSYNNARYYLEVGTLEGSSKAMIMESMFTSTEKTLLKYDKEFIYGDKTNNDYILEEIHNGILKFIELYKNINIPGCEHLDISSENAFRPLFFCLNKKEYNYSIFKNFKEYNDSLPRFKSSRSMTTVGKIMKDRGII